MKTLIDRMCRQKDTPEHTDHCSHPDGSYVGSIEYLNHERKDEWLDVYVYEAPSGCDGTSVCIRYGNEDSQYISCGNIKHLISSGIQRRGDAYELALYVIEKHGKITFIRELQNVKTISRKR